MIKTYKNIETQIKRIAYIPIISGLIITALGTSIFAQEGTIEEKVNGKVSEPTNTSYTIKEEQKSLEDISNEINQNVLKEQEDTFKIGQWLVHKETIKGKDYYFIDGLDYAFLKCEIKSDSIPTFAASANYAISQGFKEVVSAIKYKIKEIIFYRESREQKKDEEDIEQKEDEEDIYTVYVKTKYKKEDIKN